MPGPSPQTELVIVLQAQGQGTDSLTPGLVKSVINSHIAKVAHARRRQATAKRAQLIARTSEQERRSVGNRKCQIHGCQRCGTDAECSCLSSVGCRPRSQTRPSPSPDGVVHGGNSDPFSATTIVVDVTVSELLTFCRDFLLPCLHGKEVDRGRFSYADRFWHDTTQALQDECSGYAYLSRYAALIASITQQPSMDMLAMRYKDRASATLRKRLATGAGFPVTEQACWAIYSLFTAEVAAHNFLAARIHAQMLKRLIQPDSRPRQALDPRLLHAALWHEVQRSSLTLTRTTFDLDRWSEELAPSSCLDPTWKELAAQAVVPKMFSCTIPSSLESRILCDVFTEVKYLLTIIGQLGQVPSLASDSIIAKISTRSLLLEGGLVNRYLDYMDIIESEPLDGERLLSFVTVALGSLATLYWVRRAAQHEALGAGSRFSRAGSTVYTAGPLILSKMVELTVLMEASSRSPQPCPFYLWILHVCAIAEEAVNGPEGGRKTVRCGYHRRLLATHARRMGLLSWSEVESVLIDFLYFVDLSPTLEDIFEAAMAEELQTRA